MRGRWAAGAVALAALALGAFGATAVFGGDSGGRPAYATVGIEMERALGDERSGRVATRAKAKKPKVIYLQGEASTVDVSETGPYIDVRLFSCPGNSRVLDGGVFPLDPRVYQQGSYVPSDKEYHVLLGFQDEQSAADFELTSHLICIKGVK